MRPLASKTNVTPPGGDYSYGRIKDNPGDNTGTPVNEAVYGDLHQFFERLMAIAGVTANNLPENDANGYQLFTALQTVIQTYITTLKGGVPAAGDTLNKLYDLITGMGRPRGGWDASGNTVPSSDIQAGDFWRITVAGTLSGLDSGAGAVKPGDLLIAIADSLTGQSNFFCIQSNVDQATSSTLGLTKLYSDLSASNTDGAPTQAAVRAALGTLLWTTPLAFTDWNMYVSGGGSGSSSKVFAHGLADHTKVKAIHVVIRNDTDTNRYWNAVTSLSSIDASNVNLFSLLDFPAFQSTGGYVRGWISFGLEP
jgi:hypothetical protein